MKWLIAGLLVLLGPALLLLSWLTHGAFLPSLPRDDNNIQLTPFIAAFAVGLALAVIAWRKMRPAWPLLVAAAWNAAGCIFFIYGTISIWGDH